MGGVHEGVQGLPKGVCGLQRPPCLLEVARESAGVLQYAGVSICT